MEISVTQVQGKVPVTILGVQGELDASNYLDLIAKAQDLYRKGSRSMLLDLSGARFVSSSGLVAIHSIALLLHGEEPPEIENGWAVMHAIAKGLPGGVQKGLKLFKPQPRVESILAKAGFRDAFEIYNDLPAAVASF